MLNWILNFKTKTITFAAFLLFVSAFFSRILGLIRDRLLAGTFGAGAELDVYFAAFRIPDLIYGILIIGGISAAFLPIFSEHFKENQKGAWELVNNVLNCFLSLLLFICLILVIFTPQIIRFIVPGFSAAQISLTVVLTRVMLLSPIFLGISGIFSGVLQYFNRFLIYSLAPLFYNLGIIFGILFLVPIFGLLGLAYGVVFGAFLHLFVQFLGARSSGFKYHSIFNFNYPGLVRIFKLMIPRTIGQIAYHLNFIVLTAIASGLAIGSISIFNFSNNLQYFPVGLIGISFALSSFPFLSKLWAEGKKEEFLESFSLIFRQILYLILPISLLVFLLREQVVRIILGTGQFGWQDTQLTAASLGLFSLGIFAAAFIPFLARMFFSFQDTKTPAIIGIVSMLLNVFLAFFLVWVLGFENLFQKSLISFLQIGNLKGIAILALPLALSLSGIFQFSLLLIFLKRKINDIKLREILGALKKILIGVFLMGIFSYLTILLSENFLNLNSFLGILLQTILVSVVGISIYILSTLFLKSPEIKTIFYSISKQLKNEKRNS